MTAPVTVIVVSWNTRELLRACLTSLAPDIEAGRATVQVVDNASGDGSAEMVRASFPSTELIACQENLGFGAAVNLGAEGTVSPWLAIANADTELTPGALSTLLAAGERDPGAGIVAPRLVLPGGETQHSVYSFPTVPFTLALNLGLGRLSPHLADHLAMEGGWQPDRPRNVDWAIGAFLLVRRNLWEQVGGFDPEQWLFAEDLDLGWRCARAGWRTRYEPRAVVRHQGAASTSQLFRDPDEVPWLRGTYAWMRRRRGALLTRTVALINTLGAGARAALLTVPAILLGGEWSRRWRFARRWSRLHYRSLVASRSELERVRPTTTPPAPR